VLSASILSSVWSRRGSSYFRFYGRSVSHWSSTQTPTCSPYYLKLKSFCCFTVLFFRPEEGGSTLLRNVNKPQDYATLHPATQCSWIPFWVLRVTEWFSLEVKSDSDINIFNILLWTDLYICIYNTRIIGISYSNEINWSCVQPPALQHALLAGLFPASVLSLSLFPFHLSLFYPACVNSSAVFLSSHEHFSKRGEWRNALCLMNWIISANHIVVYRHNVSVCLPSVLPLEPSTNF
jgi:hypothetical protein